MPRAPDEGAAGPVVELELDEELRDASLSPHLDGDDDPAALAMDVAPGDGQGRPLALGEGDESLVDPISPHLRDGSDVIMGMEMGMGLSAGVGGGRSVGAGDDDDVGAGDDDDTNQAFLDAPQPAMGDTVRTRVRTHARVHTCMHTHTCTRTTAHTRAHTSAHTRARTRTQTHTHTHTTACRTRCWPKQHRRALRSMAGGGQRRPRLTWARHHPSLRQRLDVSATFSRLQPM